MYDNIRNVYESFPDKPLLFTEGCAESFNQMDIKHGKTPNAMADL